MQLLAPAQHRWDREIWNWRSFKELAMWCCSISCLLKSWFRNRHYLLDYHQAKACHQIYIQESHQWALSCRIWEPMSVVDWTCIPNIHQLQTNHTNPAHHFYRCFLNQPQRGFGILQCKKMRAAFCNCSLPYTGCCKFFCTWKKKSTSNCCTWTPWITRGPWTVWKTGLTNASC